MHSTAVLCMLNRRKIYPTDTFSKTLFVYSFDLRGDFLFLLTGGIIGVQIVGLSVVALSIIALIVVRILLRRGCQCRH